VFDHDAHDHTEVRTMARRCSGNGLMLAGLIVALIGLVSALTTVLDLPRYWTTMLIGAALFLAGAARRALGGRTQDSSGPGAA
jgi:hypothetical protein